MAEKLEWMQIHITDSNAKAAYAKYQASVKETNELRSKVEDLLRPKANKICPKGNEVIFAFRWGKVSMAFKEPEKKSSKSSDAIEL